MRSLFTNLNASIWRFCRVGRRPGEESRRHLEVIEEERQEPCKLCNNLF
jgi:hypothetical protein